MSHHWNKSFNRLLSIQLLDACASNCGKVFHLEIASRDFESDLRKLINHPQPRIVEKIKVLLKKWVEGDFKTDPQLNLIPSLYNKLKNEGHDFSTVSDTVSHGRDNLFIAFILPHRKRNIEYWTVYSSASHYSNLADNIISYWHCVRLFSTCMLCILQLPVYIIDCILNKMSFGSCNNIVTFRL